MTALVLVLSLSLVLLLSGAVYAARLLTREADELRRSLAPPDLPVMVDAADAVGNALEHQGSQ